MAPHVRSNSNPNSNRPFVADYKDEDGKRRQEGFFTEEDAINVVEVAKKREQGMKPFPELAAWYIADLDARGIHPSTIQNAVSINRVHWLPAFGNSTVGEVGVVQWRLFREHLGAKELSPARILHICKVASHMYNRAVVEGLVDVNPLIQANGTMPKYFSTLPITYPTAAEVDLVLGAASPWLRLALMLVIHAGLRANEVVSVKWEDVDFEAGKIDVYEKRRSDSAKALSGKRSVPMSSELSKALYCARPTVAAGWIFPTIVADAHRTAGSLLLVLRELMIKLKLTRALPDERVLPLYGPKEFRHLAALAWKRDGVSVRKIAKYMGISRVMTVEMKYRAHFRDKRDRGFVAKAAALIFRKKG